MAEPLVDAPAVAIVEEVDLSLDVADAAEAVAVAEEFDFELGQAELQRDDGDGPSSSLNKIEIGPDPDMDEINYEEETGHDALVPEAAEAKLDAPSQDDGADEIDYEDTDVHATVTHDNDDAAEGGEQHDIDFGFDDAGEGHAGNENDENDHDHGEYDHEEGDDSHQNNEDEDRDMSDFKQDEDEDDEDEENDENRTQHNAPSQQHYVVDDDEDSDSDSGLSPLQSFYPVTTFDVMVTWGDEVCPLFKTPDTNAPGSFYLEDYEAMNYPLSKFLQTIRSSISSWVRSSDEILIRVDELGLEFGETTTEALLGQVTFHNLLALHNTLVKNDDAEMTKGVHITLSTRSNCLLRLKDLVGGADSGKGLSAFPWTSSRADASSDDSGEVEEEEEEEEEEDEDEEEAESGDSSPAGEADEMVEEDDGEEIEDDIEDEGEEDGVDVEMAARQSERSRSNSLEHEDGVAVEGFVETVVKEAGRSELDTPTADEDPDAVEEADYINYTHDEVDDNVEGVHLNPDGVADLPTPHADGDELDFANAEDNLIDGLAADEAKLNEVDDLDLLEDINDAGDIVKNDQSSDAAAAEDDFLDLNGDIDDTAASAATLEASNKADDLEPSLDTSATATLDNDEIDYEDSRPEGEKNGAAALDTGGDEEIDWDVEIKNTASADATTTSPTSGKRTRDVDEAGDALLDDLPDVKRVRTGDTP